MISIGLTGGMGMGKSTVAKMIVRHGVPHWDADAEVARFYGWNLDDPEPEQPRLGKLGRLSDWMEATKVNEEPHHQAHSRCLVEDIRSLVPTAVVRPAGRNFDVVDRYALRAAVEADKSLLDRLEPLAAPRLIRSAQEFLTYYVMVGKWPILFDAPLWFENRVGRSLFSVIHDEMFEVAHILARPCSTVTIVVSCPPELQRERCFARPGMTEEKFRFLVERQLPDEARREKADYVIDTSKPLETVAEQVDSIMAELKATTPVVSET